MARRNEQAADQQQEQQEQRPDIHLRPNWRIANANSIRQARAVTLPIEELEVQPVEERLPTKNCRSTAGFRLGCFPTTDWAIRIPRWLVWFLRQPEWAEKQPEDNLDSPSVDVKYLQPIGIKRDHYYIVRKERKV